MHDLIPPRDFLGLFWRGTSTINGAPIAVVFTGFEAGSANAKTGEMIQSWILLDTPEKPHEALKSGADYAICGDCKYRPFYLPPVAERKGDEPRCYVLVHNAPRAVHDALQRGRYTELDLSLPWQRELFRGRQLRLGAYGDPYAAGFSLWASVLAQTATTAHTGYTHQWRQPGASRFKQFLMASVDSQREWIQATEAGWRTFRVKRSNDPILPSELPCPASEEQGYRLTCDTCNACAGTLFGRSNVAINGHALMGGN